MYAKIKNYTKKKQKYIIREVYFQEKFFAKKEISNVLEILNLFLTFWKKIPKISGMDFSHHIQIFGFPFKRIKRFMINSLRSNQVSNIFCHSYFKFVFLILFKRG